MGANAATKLFRVIENCYSIQGIELLHAAQALEFRRPLKSGKRQEEVVKNFRTVVPFVHEDCYMHPLMSASKEFVKNMK
jgi:histidine ammonia-lyase